MKKDYHPCPSVCSNLIRSIGYLNSFEAEDIKRLARSVLDRVLRKDVSKDDPSYKRHKAISEIPYNAGGDTNPEIKRIANIFNVDLQIAKKLFLRALETSNRKTPSQRKKQRSAIANDTFKANSGDLGLSRYWEAVKNGYEDESVAVNKEIAGILNLR
jgi:AAA15 family ATPase/GTPase